MDHFGILSIIPPVIAIILALKTKEVISSLLIGIMAGALIFAHGNIIATVETTFEIMGSKMSDNSLMLLFLGLLGCLVVMVTKAGGSEAYGKWATTKIKNRVGAGLATAFLGMIIFIDDYFNCLTVGTVMKPVTDKYKISRAKLAYIIDSTAAPICIIAPVSSWAASVIATIGEAGVADPLTVFMNTIPFNLYAILTIATVLFFACSTKDFGPMQDFNIEDTSRIEDEVEIEGHGHASVLDLIIPILTLIIGTVLSMLYTGGAFNGESISYAFGNCSVNQSLVYGAFLGLIAAFIMYIPRKLMTFKEYMDGINEGIKSMVPAIVILILAWTIGGICSQEYLNTGGFVGSLMAKNSIPFEILPVVTFAVAGLLAFATGTAWGTFGILVPIMVPILFALNADESLVVILAAIFSGAVFGDHCSPISDTTILSSAGAKCKHIDHVRSQIPYATVVAIASMVGFTVAGITHNAIITLITAFVTLFVVITIAKKFVYKQKLN